MSDHEHRADGHDTDGRRTDEHRDLSAVRAVAGEDENRDDTPEVERDAEAGPDAPAGVKRHDDPGRDFSVAGSNEPFNSDKAVMERARRNTEAGAAPGTIHDPNSVTTGTEVEPKG